MRMLESRKRQERQVTCVACATHMHPEMVPWLQHSIGCEVRTAELGRNYTSTSSRAGRVAAAASPRP
jgi:hypothetical protein